MKTTTTFDADELVRGFEQWDLPALLELYDDDVDVIQVDHDHGPSEPRIMHGKEIVQKMYEYSKSAGVTATVENVVAAEDRVAATVTCTFPNGRKVAGNVIFDLRDGRIVREHEVIAGDQGG